MVAAGTMATICLEAGLCQHAMLILPVFLASIGGIAASAIKMRGRPGARVTEIQSLPNRG
jgi:hypothetical protein